jgi:hypothetical protein
VKAKSNLHVKILLQWFWLKSDLHKPWNGIAQVPFGLGQDSSIMTKPIKVSLVNDFFL